MTSKLSSKYQVNGLRESESAMRKTKRLKALKGMVPSILDMGDGCKFCSRFDPEECPCLGTKENQELFEASSGHFVRCNKELLNG